MTLSTTTSVIQIPVRGSPISTSFYSVQILICGGSQSRTFLISETVSARLWDRFLSYQIQSNSTVQFQSRAGATSRPGKNCNRFIRLLEKAIEQKYEANVLLSSLIALSSLYKLWVFSSGVNTELFADCFNESGVLKHYCSLDSEDDVFGSLGKWEECEKKVKGGAANPPFHPTVINSLINRSDEGTRTPLPYCRCAVLSLGNRYNVIGRMKEVNSEGKLLVTAPPGCVPFRREQSLLSTEHLKAKPNIYQSIGVFIWCNREYHLKDPVALDIQELSEGSIIPFTVLEKSLFMEKVSKWRSLQNLEKENLVWVLFFGRWNGK